MLTIPAFSRGKESSCKNGKWMLEKNYFYRLLSLVSTPLQWLNESVCLQTTSPKIEVDWNFSDLTQKVERKVKNRESSESKQEIKKKLDKSWLIVKEYFFAQVSVLLLERFPSISTVLINWTYCQFRKTEKFWKVASLG